ncbi:hypothetical protein Syun_021229 [Stephania yunnanensis]|uniref:Uncharacterized protein n=1 Tax=Stephania yunnanensis TaxID=152371 RepID=A0AAP0IFM4_9MAGN
MPLRSIEKDVCVLLVKSRGVGGIQLKKYFIGHEIDDEYLEMAPKDIQDDQWALLVEYWKSEESKAMAKSCQNRAKQGLPHKAGCTRFCDIRH